MVCLQTLFWLIVLVNLAKKVAEQIEELSLHRYLGTLFSTEMKPEEKFSLLEKEYGPVDENMEEEVVQMFNLSDMLVEEGIEKGIEKMATKIGDAFGITSSYIQRRRRKANSN